jgi:riboflavin kinase/FMN adenylyltransferase
VRLNNELSLAARRFRWSDMGLAAGLTLQLAPRTYGRDDDSHDFLTIETPMLPQNFRVVRDRAGDATLHGAVVAIGNFDGVHRGHKAVIATAQRRAMELHRPAAVLTFEPHPRVFFNPGEKLFRLTDEAAKLRLLAATGLDGAIVLTFDAALAKLTAEEFVTRILLERFRIGGAVIGFNFHFGAKRGGSPDFLVAQGKQRGFTVDIVPPLTDGGRPVSSGPIRQALEAGDLATAADLLGFPWFVPGEVIHGDKRGRELGFPTANLALDPACGLRHGIYAVRVAVDGRRYDAVASFGRRPTFDNGPVLLEVFLFDFAGDLYGKSIDVAFIAFIRDEKAFASAADLVRQMHDDSSHAREALARAGDVFPPI